MLTRSQPLVPAVASLAHTDSAVGTRLRYRSVPEVANPDSAGDESDARPARCRQSEPPIVAGLPFVEALARRMAASMPNSIDIGDLVQDGVLGLIDAAHRFDEARGIKFETFAERRVRGAMIDALRTDAWPRGVRRQRRELDAAREALRRELGHEPSMADLAARVGSDEKRLSRTIVRINTIEATSPLATGEHFDESSLPTALVPSEPDAPDAAYEKRETRDRVRAAIAVAALARAEGDRPLLLRRSDDEGDRRGDRRERIARLAAACARHPPPARRARRDGPAAGRGDAQALVAFAAKKPMMAKADARRQAQEAAAQPGVRAAVQAGHRKRAGEASLKRRPRRAGVAAAR